MPWMDGDVRFGSLAGSLLLRIIIPIRSRDVRILDDISRYC